MTVEKKKKLWPWSNYNWTTKVQCKHVSPTKTGLLQIPQKHPDDATGNWFSSVCIHLDLTETRQCMYTRFTTAEMTQSAAEKPAWTRPKIPHQFRSQTLADDPMLLIFSYLGDRKVNQKGVHINPLKQCILPPTVCPPEADTVNYLLLGQRVNSDETSSSSYEHSCACLKRQIWLWRSFYPENNSILAELQKPCFDTWNK